MKRDNSADLYLPVIPLRGIVLLPGMIVHLDIGRKRSMQAVYASMKSNQQLFVVAQKEPLIANPNIKDIYSVGMRANLLHILKEDEDGMRIVIQGDKRACVAPVEYRDKSNLKILPDKLNVNLINEKKFIPTIESEASLRSLKLAFSKYVEVAPKLADDFLAKFDSKLMTLGRLVDYITSNIYLDYMTKQTILETLDQNDRAHILMIALEKEVNIIKTEQELFEKAKDKVDETQRDIILREQKKIIEEELGEVGSTSEIELFRKRIIDLKLNKDVEETLLKECNKLQKSPFGSMEGAMISTYLDTCLSLPWNDSTEVEIDLQKVRNQLDKDHYGLTKVKDRIIEMLAVMKLNENSKGNIICLIGPPGTGKTSIALSIAKAIGRNSQRISLGGVTDEAEIRGHRRTYVGSMPGRIINAIIKAKSNNPLLILDEVDKLSKDYKGDPTAALLEVLDPEQNYSFEDHFIDLPFDLSNTMFITTANDYDQIPSPLRDRMDIIELSSYTRVEKFNIAKKHLIPKQLKSSGLKRKNINFTNKAIYILIDSYTREAGVRNLERVIASVMRKVAIKVVEDSNLSFKVTEENILDLLGPVKYIDDESNKIDEIGVVNGLAWTSVGGTILPIECITMNGTGKIELTGSLGDVMQESAKTAISCIRSKSALYDINPDFYKEYDIHVHAPDGATPKDGPSAGITMAIALYSALTLSPVKHDFAMTGEITLRGKILPIGGLREKVMAAYKAKIKNIIIPKENIKDLSEIEDEIKSKINFYPVSYIDEAINLCCLKSKKEKENTSIKSSNSSKRTGGRISIRQ